MENTAIVTIPLGNARLQLPAEDLIRCFVTNAQASTCARETTTSQRTPPAIGQFWHGQGGVYAGLMRGENGMPDYHLIVPTAKAGYVEEITWGERGRDIAGATSEYDGRANTAALCRHDDAHPAAEWAAGLEIDGFSDWYLPSRRELRLCWVNVPELFVGGWHWTSTQFSAHDAWFQLFDDGGQLCNGKVIALRARAVRRFISH